MEFKIEFRGGVNMMFFYDVELLFIVCVWFGWDMYIFSVYIVCSVYGVFM